jgi:hypothetical protein
MTTNLNTNNNVTWIDKNVECVMQVKSSIRGGKSLDVTGYKFPVIKSGHLIISDPVTDDYKPMPLNEEGTAYAALPDLHVYKGVLIATIKTSDPFAGILTEGSVNRPTMPFSITSFLSEVRAALPSITFRLV